MLFGLGTDVVEVSRIRSAYLRYGRKFVERVLSPPEQAVFDACAGDRQVEFLAGRFAAKEAVAKAAGCGLGRLQMARVEIGLGEHGLEVRMLGDHNLPSVTDFRWHVSITHTRDLAFAVAIRERLGRADG